MEGNDACVAMHTALRKCCDSPATSAMYNLIHLICSDDGPKTKYSVWHAFGDLVAKNLKEHEPVSAAKVALQELEEWWYGLVDVRRKAGKSQRALGNPRHWFYTFTCLLESFDAEEWDGLTCFLEREEPSA